MANQNPADKAPTMIIPRGADFQIDAHGQLSIRTPGNLVIQNSGSYGVIESYAGSIRIEPHAEVEAVNVRCASTCYIQGTLTAWKVEAEDIRLEDGAQANVVLQESQRLAIGREARMVGNFGTEKELFHLFSRFSDQLRSMPMFARGRDPQARIGEEGTELLLEQPTEDAPKTVEKVEQVEPVEPETIPTGRRSDGELPDPLFYALVLLEREFARAAYGPTSQRVLEELIKLLQERDFDTLKVTYRTLFSRIVEPRKDVKRALELMQRHFKQPTVVSPE